MHTAHQNFMNPGNPGAVYGQSVTQHLTISNTSCTDVKDNEQVAHAMKTRVVRKLAQMGVNPDELEARSGERTCRVRSAANVNLRVDHGDVAFVIHDAAGNVVSDQIRSQAAFDTTLPRVATSVSGLLSYTEIAPLGVICAGPGNNTFGRATASLVIGGAINIKNTGNGPIAYGESIHVIMPTADGNHNNIPLGQDTEGWDGVARPAVYSERELRRISVAHQNVFPAAHTDPIAVTTPIFAVLHALAQSPTPAHAHQTAVFIDTLGLSSILADHVSSWLLESALPRNRDGAITAKAFAPNNIVLTAAHAMLAFVYKRSYLGVALENALPGQLFKIRVK